ncbi:FecR family protein [Parapedobacter koreensis]|uniref:FecR family protein n=1 Tax=Parapedobacter koreensis TaxID=332977 RepID=A0A1H7SB10_9SPHI|nr:FecR family protein [Parapedobacter koreensis]SEL69715.1 FecR family protein [Parapedobacter koreensis]
MDGKRIIVLLARRAAGEISVSESAELDNLLANHPDTVYYEEFVQELWKAPEQETDVEQFFDWHKQRHGKALFFEEEEAVAQPLSGTSTGAFWRRLGRQQLVLYALVLVIGATGLWLFIGNKAEVLPDRIEIVAEKGVRKQFQLPDGTKVWLNADSRLWYDSKMQTNGTRAVELQGEGYFDVEKDSKRPFIISTEKISIRVLGTAFNVKAYPDDDKTETTLIRGSIELSVNDRPHEKIVMKPNEKVAISNYTPVDNPDDGDQKSALTLTIGSLSKVQVADGEYIQETSWVDDKLVFRNETLAELVPKIERWYNVNVNVTNPNVMAYRYTSTITEEDDIHQLLEALQFIHSFNYKIENHDVTIY